MNDFQKEYSGESLKQKRLNALLTQDELAQKVGVNRMVVSHWETGFRRPSIKNIRALRSLLEEKPEKATLE